MQQVGCSVTALLSGLVTANRDKQRIIIDKQRGTERDLCSKEERDLKIIMTRMVKREMQATIVQHLRGT